MAFRTYTKRHVVETTTPTVTNYGKGRYRGAVGLFFSDNTVEIHAVDCADHFEANGIARALHDRLRQEHGLPYRPPPPPRPRPNNPRRY